MLNVVKLVKYFEDCDMIRDDIFRSCNNMGGDVVKMKVSDLEDYLKESDELVVFDDLSFEDGDWEFSEFLKEFEVI